jgi:hypothetical protein
VVTVIVDLASGKLAEEDLADWLESSAKPK